MLIRAVIAGVNDPITTSAAIQLVTSQTTIGIATMMSPFVLFCMTEIITHGIRSILLGTVAFITFFGGLM